MDIKRKVAVVGLGYVGLPLAVALAKHGHVVGYDINSKRIEQLNKHIDITDAIFKEDFQGADIEFTTDSEFLASANFYIITVPTPVDKNNKPCLKALMSASKVVGQYLKQGDIVVYESTVYPGCTEEECAPELEKFSGLKCGTDFKIGYSPERINPSDHIHTLDKVIKIVSAQDSETLEIVASVYGQVVDAGLHKAESIQVAEAAKIIENTQRDLNIAFMNELAKVFDSMGIDTNQVINAAATKWNFMPMRPGLVGGHCIGVDPYYLIDKADRLNFNLDIIKTAREVNNNMSDFVAQKAISKLESYGIAAKDATIAVLGITFKENCPDIRNSRAVDVVKYLKQQGGNVLVHDPEIKSDYAEAIADIELSSWDDLENIDVMLITVGHNYYKELQMHDFLTKFSSEAVFSSTRAPIILDVRAILDTDTCEINGVDLWQL